MTHKVRMMCVASCTITDDYDATDSICRHCGHSGLVRSEHIDEDCWTTHQQNKKLIAHLESLLSDVKATVAEFEKGWESTWNSEGPTQLNYESPESYRLWLNHFENT